MEMYKIYEDGTDKLYNYITKDEITALEKHKEFLKAEESEIEETEYAYILETNGKTYYIEK